jgi:D-xylose 1-dehydrogenase (NADP+, D-xylono-1,5-lactone-forming)
MAAGRVRWGMLSTARIGMRRLAPALQHSHTGVLVAIASRDAARAKEAAAKLGAERAHASYDALLNDPEIDAVYNPLPNSLHREWTIRAARAGKHVLCEKPLAANAQEAQEMADACRRAGVLLAEAFMYRFHPQTERLQRLVADGAIGQAWLVRSAFTFPVTSDTDIRLDPTLGGGGLMDVGCYCVNISRLLFGEPVAVAATAGYERRVDVRLSAVLRFSGERAALLDCGLRAPYRQFCEVVGTEGTITVLQPFQPEDKPAAIVVRKESEENRVKVPGTNQYTLMVDHIGACILEGKSLRYPAEDAVANMRVLDALAEAARTSATVRI